MSSLIIIAPTESEQPRVRALTGLCHACGILHTHTRTHTHIHTHTKASFTYEQLKLINYLDTFTQSQEAFFQCFSNCLFVRHSCCCCSVGLSFERNSVQDLNPPFY